MPVNTPHDDYTAHEAKWKRCRDTFDGQDAVKAARTDYLPALSAAIDDDSEATAAYNSYLFHAQFFNGVAPTVVALIGAVFLKSMRWENVPAPTEKLFTDVTRNGVTLEQFSRDMVGQVVHPGRYGVLVDMPAEARPGVIARPYFIGYRAEDIVNWRAVAVAGQLQTVLVVLRETDVAPKADDPFVMEPVVRYRELSLRDGRYTVQLWRKSEGSSNEGDKWVEDGPPITPLRRGDPLPFIPFTFVGPEGTTPGISDPPLMSLVDVNLGHYLNSADYEWGCHLTALPTPVISGVSGNPVIHIGSSRALVFEDAQASAKYLEFSGSGLSALKDAMTEKRTQMAALGGRVLENPQVSATATEIRMRHAAEHASLTNIAQSCSQALSNAVRWMAWWMGTDTQPDENLAILLNQDFMAIDISAEELKAAMLAWQSGAISFEQFFQRLQRGGFYAPGTTIEDEQARIEEEEAKRQMQAERDAELEAKANGGGGNPSPELEE